MENGRGHRVGRTGERLVLGGASEQRVVASEESWEDTRYEVNPY